MRNALLVGCALVAACNPNSIGRPCVNPNNQPVRGVQLASPALECPSRLCLIEPPNAAAGDVTGLDGGTPRATCTSACAHDADCTPETTSRCAAGFVCAVASDVGPFRCQRLCVCRSDLVQDTNVDRDGGVITPPSCVPSSP
jgi:hypothetical protein